MQSPAQLFLRFMPPFIGTNFTSLEQAVLNAICEMHLADRHMLEAQLLSAIVRSRENTGAGFFTRFDVERTAESAIRGERLRNGPEVRIDGLQHGMGFILWLKNGYAECLEGYSYQESTVSINLEQTGFEIELHKKRISRGEHL